MTVPEILVARFDQTTARFLLTFAHVLTALDLSPHYWTTESTDNPSRPWATQLERKPIVISSISRKIQEIDRL